MFSFVDFFIINWNTFFPALFMNPFFLFNHRYTFYNIVFHNKKPPFN